MWRRHHGSQSGVFADEELTPLRKAFGVSHQVEFLGTITGQFQLFVFKKQRDKNYYYYL